MSIGGRTAWYCSNCGLPLRQGVACQCGGSGVPSNQPLEVGERGGIGATLRGLVARLTGRGGQRPTG